MKTCTKCHIEKPLPEFGKHAVAKDGLQSRCRSCISADGKKYCLENADKRRKSVNASYRRNIEKYKAYYVRNSERLKAKSSVYYAANKSQRIEVNSKWRLANPERMRVFSRAWAEANPEKVKRAKKNWDTRNPEKTRNYVRNRYARKKAVGGKLSREIEITLFAQQEGRCVYCGTDLSTAKVHLDHRMPISLGGTNTEDNVQLLCQKCNQRKSAKHPDDFERQIGYIK